jgi:hypothetical protein
MSYSPIRLEQLNIPQLSGYILEITAGIYVLTTGNQNIEGVKTFLDGLIGYDSSGNSVLNSLTRTFSGDWQYGGQTIGPSGLVNLPFLQDGQYNLPQTVRTTGNQSISGEKIFRSTVSFIDNISIGDSLIGSTVGTAIYSNDEEAFVDFGEGGRLGSVGAGVTLDWTALKISGAWEAQNLRTNAARINRRVINQSSYSVLSSDYYLAVNTSGSAKTLIFPQASDNRVYKIKDVSGQATGNAITLSGSGVTFDYQSVYVISDAYASIELIAGSGNNYEVF